MAARAFDDILGDQFDIRDVIERFEELEEQVAADEGADESTAEFAAGEDERTEFAAIKSFLEEVKGYGGDEQWRGDWYPLQFIRDSYFEEYAEEFAEDIGAINKDAKWPNNHIDWTSAAHDLQNDYSTVEIDEVTYWYR